MVPGKEGIHVQKNEIKGPVLDTHTHTISKWTER